MTTGAAVKWSIEADYLQACNCDYGCPCEFEAPPTQGFCHGIGIWNINRGSYGSVSLDGLGLGFVLDSPAALHLGNITLALFVDEKASEEQRQSLVQIASGQAGGMPFEIIASLVTNLSGPHFVPFEVDIQGRNSSGRMGDAASVAFEPVKNPSPESQKASVSTTKPASFSKARMSSRPRNAGPRSEIWNFPIPTKLASSPR